MFGKIMKGAKRALQKFVQPVVNLVNAIKARVQMAKVQMTASAMRVVAGTAAESYVDTGVKILIAVVIGALLLAGLYALFNTTIMPRVTERVEGLFNYNG
jgi:hypothetical protein